MRLTLRSVGEHVLALCHGCGVGFAILMGSLFSGFAWSATEEPALARVIVYVTGLLLIFYALYFVMVEYLAGPLFEWGARRQLRGEGIRPGDVPISFVREPSGSPGVVVLSMSSAGVIS